MMNSTNKKNKIAYNGKLHGKVQRKMNTSFFVFLLCGVVMLWLAVSLDIGVLKGVRHFIENWIGENALFLYRMLKKIKIELKSFCELVITLSTILTAAVVFYYSVQDSKKEGIPNRTIMAYSFGSNTVPVLFIVTMLMLPLHYLWLILHLYWTVCIGLVFSYLMQMMIIILILMSTSYEYSIYAISNVEIRQFQFLNKMEEVTVDEEKYADICEVKDKKFAGTYLLYHLEQVVKSDEMIADKMRLAHRIIRAPYYEKEERFGGVVWKRICKRNKDEIGYKLSYMGLKSNNLKRVYEFYYGNILAVMQSCRESEHIEIRNNIYNLLYEFVEEMTELNTNVQKQLLSMETKNKCKIKYLMTISGIINAVLVSNTEEAEIFCNYVLNHMTDKETWNIQFSLYVLFQEYLYRVTPEAIKLNNLEGINGIGKWEKIGENSEEVLISFWEIWFEFTTVPESRRNLYLRVALESLQGTSYESGPIVYIRQVIEQMREQKVYESKSNTND